MHIYSLDSLQTVEPVLTFVGTERTKAKRLFNHLVIERWKLLFWLKCLFVSEALKLLLHLSSISIKR